MARPAARRASLPSSRPGRSIRLDEPCEPRWGDPPLEDPLDYVARNGDLLLYPLPGFRCAEILADLTRRGLVRRDPWTGRLVPTDSARRRLGGSTDLEE